MRTWLVATLTLALALISGPARATRSPTSQLRPPLQNDFDRCAVLAADQGNESIQGRVRLTLLVRESGNVYAALVHSAPGIDDKRLMSCLTGFAVFWRFPPAAVDYARPYELAFVPGGTEIDFSPSLYHAGIHYSGQGRASVFMPGLDDQPQPRAMDPGLAQATLEVAEWATDAEKGIAEVSVMKYPEALVDLRAALQAAPNDPIALRGLAQALSESHGDLAEARAAADLLASVRPGSVVAHEAVLRTCLAAGDDLCVVKSFNAASHAADLAPRSRLLFELQPQAELAAERLNKNVAAARKYDICTGLEDPKAMAMCLVRRCLDEGTNGYASELKTKPGPWTLSQGGPDEYVASRSLGDGQEDARWLVKFGAKSVKMTPVNGQAREVSKRRTSCVVVDPAVVNKDKGVEVEHPLVRAR
ncbi:MAG: hypothetical protein JST92_18975 [Deltaproteobacteria bacterium]|nr:hypothetical protein [Deltaproteobacteria bacterium]